MTRAIKAPTRGGTRGLLVALTTVAVLAMAACGSSSSDSPNKEGSKSDTLRIAVSNVVAPTVLDPALGASTGPDIFFDLAYAPLIHIAQDGTYEPALAQEFGYTDGDAHKEFQLTLREDARFSDGTPVDAKAVKAWLEYYMSAGGPFAASLGIGTEIETPSEYKVVLKLTAPNPDLPWLLAQTNGSGFVAATAGLKNKTLTKKTLGAGQYVYDARESVPGDTLVLTPNEYYYDQDAIRWNKVVIKVVASATSLVQGMASDQFDVGVGSIGTVAAAEKAGLEVIDGELSWDGLTFLNRTVSPWDDEQVRQAVNYAIDRDTLVEGILAGQGTATSAWWTMDGLDEASNAKYPYDPEMAKSLLAEAGYDSGVTLKVLGSSGSLTSGTPTEQLTQALAQQLEGAGIKLETKLVPATQLIPEAMSGKYDALLASFGINAYGTYYPIFIAEQAFLNQGHVVDPTLEELTGEYLTAADPGSVSVQITQYVTDQALLAPLFVPKAVMFTTDDISNVAFPKNASGVSQAIFPDPTEWE